MSYHAGWFLSHHGAVVVIGTKTGGASLEHIEFAKTWIMLLDQVITGVSEYIIYFLSACGASGCTINGL
jgi:hypothetical protein